MRQKLVTSASLQNDRYNIRINRIRRRSRKLSAGRAPISQLFSRDHRRQRLHFAYEHVRNNEDWGRI